MLVKLILSRSRWTMMAIFTLFVFAGLLVCAVCLTWGLLYALGLILKSRFRWRGTRLAWVCLLLAVVIVGGGVGFEGWLRNRPEAIFGREFGIAVPIGTTLINAESSALGDSGRAYIHFTCRPETIRAIVAHGHYIPGDDGYHGTGDLPAWYKPGSGSSLQSFDADTAPDSVKSDFHSQHRSLIFDPATNDAWYEFAGVD